MECQPVVFRGLHRFVIGRIHNGLDGIKSGIYVNLSDPVRFLATVVGQLYLQGSFPFPGQRIGKERNMAAVEAVIAVIPHVGTDTGGFLFQGQR